VSTVKYYDPAARARALRAYTAAVLDVFETVRTTTRPEPPAAGIAVEVGSQLVQIARAISTAYGAGLPPDLMLSSVEYIITDLLTNGPDVGNPEDVIGRVLHFPGPGVVTPPPPEPAPFAVDPDEGGA
jgi:hypothetical protein